MNFRQPENLLNGNLEFGNELKGFYTYLQWQIDTVFTVFGQVDSRLSNVAGRQFLLLYFKEVLLNKFKVIMTSRYHFADF